MDEPIATTPWNAADHIETPEDVIEFLKAALEENDLTLLTDALDVVARTEGMAALAKRAGVPRELLLKAAPGRDSALQLLLKVTEMTGLRLDIRAKDLDPTATHRLPVGGSARKALENKAKLAGVFVERLARRRLSVEQMLAVGNEIAAMPLLDDRSPREIMDDIDAL